jgi:hypothetical protein
MVAASRVHKKIALPIIFEQWWEKLGPTLDCEGPDSCWLWTGNRSGQGRHQYGMMRIKFPDQQQTVPVRVHRILFMIKIKEITLPKGLEVSHLCGNSLCCNPQHLTLEEHYINLHRVRCQAMSVCVGHENQPNCLL